MIELTAENLRKEYEAAKTKREGHLDNFDERIKALAGEAASYKDPAFASTVNHQGAYMAVMLPRLDLRNLRAACSMRQRGTMISNPSMTIDQQAELTKRGLDTWVKYCSFADEHWLVARDFLMEWGVTKFVRRTHPGITNPYGEDSVLPMVERVPLYRFVMDPLCDDFRKARWHGDVWSADLDDLKKWAKEEAEKSEENDEGGWDLDAIEKLSAKTGLDELGDREDSSSVERDEVVCVDFWFRENQPDPELGPADGFNGAMVTLAISNANDEAAIVRKETPYFGPPIGPYELFGVYNRFKSPWPQSPLAMSAEQEALLRDMVAEANKGAKQYRKVVLVPAGTQAKKAAKLASVAADMIIEVPGLPSDAKPIEIELGGVTDQQIKNMVHAERQLHLVSGMDQAQQGEVTGDGTATEHAIAETSTQNRIGGVIDRYLTGVRNNLWRFAWYFWKDEEIMLPIAAGMGAEGEGIAWVGGGSEDVDWAMFDLMNLDIDPMSVGRVTEETLKRRMLEAMNLMTQIIPLMIQYPFVDWNRKLGMIGDAMNLPDLGSLIDMNMLSQMIGVQLNEGQGGGAGAGGAGGGPRSLDAGLGPQRREVAGRLTGAAANPSAAGVA